MGRYAGSGKATTGDFHSIDVRRWARDGLLSTWFNWAWWRDGEKVSSINVHGQGDAVKLNYRTRSYGDDWTDVDEHIWLERTACHLGGSRPWFVCPGCGRQCAVLYLAGRSRCRRCLGLAYESQRENAMHRALRKAQKLRAQLGGSLSLGEPLPDRPHYMHERTYQRLCGRIDAAEYASDCAFLGWAYERGFWPDGA